MYLYGRVMNKEQKTFEKENAHGNNQHLYPFIPYNNESEFTCVGCGETKPHTDFRKRKGGLISTGCRGCVNKKYERDPLRGHYNALKCRAKKEGIPFNITLEDLEIPEVCPVLGIPLKSWGENNVGGYMEDSPSIDKFIPEFGYVKGNVSVISFKANLLKRDGTLAEIEKLYEWMKRTTEEVKNSSLINQ